MRRAAKIDRNQPEIVQALRKCGAVSQKKMAAAIRNARLGTEAVKRSIKTRKPWACKHCGIEKPATVHQMRQTYCSKTCMAAAYSARMAGSANPNYKNAGRKNCVECGSEFISYNKEARFCSIKCRDVEAKGLRTSAKKDANHHEIVKHLEGAGVKVLDLTRAMFGCPDLVVWWKKEWHLIEIKNPKNHYGKRGLNPMQAKWLSKWQGGPVYICRTKEDVDKFLAGTLKAEIAGEGAAVHVVTDVESSIRAIQGAE